MNYLITLRHAQFTFPVAAVFQYNISASSSFDFRVPPKRNLPPEFTEMHTVDLLEEALALAEREGFSVRRQWLGETTGGACRIGSQRVLFVNLSLTADEQLHQVLAGIRNSESKSDRSAVSSTLRRLIS